MTALEQQMIDELTVAQGFTNDLVSNLITKGVPANTSEGLDTLVPKVLEIESGAAQTPYDEWQEGFGYNWDTVVANAPMTNTQRILHVYTKVELLKMASNFPTTAEIYTFNGSVYRQITMDANKRLSFIADDYITNTSDNLQYVCVVYGNASWESGNFITWLPVVYGNSRAVTLGDADGYVNLLGTTYAQSYYPTLRGVDVNILFRIYFPSGLEHLTYQATRPSIPITFVGVGNSEIRLFKEVCDTLPSGQLFSTEVGFSQIRVKITDEALADWFYNTWLYTNFTTETQYAYPAGNYVRKFKVNSAMQLKAAAWNAAYIRGIPNCDYIDGTFTENQTSSANNGFHGFNSNTMRNLKNFPMWTVLEGATTGCLLPMTNQTNVNNYLSGSFRFYSTNLEPNKFCEFDENGIIEDPTKYFICNLPIETETHVNIQVKFDDLTFKNYFTAAQQSAISTYLTNKKWNLIWS